jgi:hypothetical protein
MGQRSRHSASDRARRGTRIGRGRARSGQRTRSRQHAQCARHGIIGAMPIHPYETDFSESRFRVAHGRHIAESVAHLAARECRGSDRASLPLAKTL